MAQDNAWEVEVHAGGLFTRDISGGATSLPTVAEFNFDCASTPFEARAGVQPVLESTAVSFRPVFEALLPAPLFVGRNPGASSSLEIGDGSEIVVTGVVRISLITRGRIIPYATADSTTLPPSSLSGRAITDFKTFEASGTRQQVLLSVGYFYRF